MLTAEGLDEGSGLDTKEGLVTAGGWEDWRKGDPKFMVSFTKIANAEGTDLETVLMFGCAELEVDRE